MTHEELLDKLFDGHLADLQSVIPSIADIFVCPICLKEFSRGDIALGKLTEGHVWPEGIRQKTETGSAARQRVLLCKQCNSTAGSHGDKQMQLREKVKAGERSGEMYGRRRLQVLRGAGERPIDLFASVHVSPTEAAARITFEKGVERNRWVGVDPSEMHRFLRAAEHSAPCSIVIHPHHELKSDLARAGWITSGYLLAFWSLGYRYILSEYLHPIRRYILDSFEQADGQALEFPEVESFGLHECGVHYCTEPELVLVVPLDEETPVYLQVSFLDYHVRLPFLFNQEALSGLLCARRGTLERVSDLAEHEGACLHIDIQCCKADGHDCIWDYVLGRQLPAE